MKCPECGRLTSVLRTERLDDHIRRRRECSAGHRSTSFEVIDRRGPDRPQWNSDLARWLRQERSKEGVKE